jgi:hypothetical protein
VIVTGFCFVFCFGFGFGVGFGFGFVVGFPFDPFYFYFIYFSSFFLMFIVRLMRVLVPNDDRTILRSPFFVCPICLFAFLYSFRFVLFRFDSFRSVLLDYVIQCTINTTESYC